MSGGGLSDRNAGPRRPRSSLAAWSRAFRDDGPILVVCTALVAAGVALRAQSLDFPGHLTFDEHHFVENARNYLADRADWNDHPPLGKLFIALAMSVLGDRPVAWRLSPLVFGLVSIALGYCIATKLFRTKMAGFFAASLLAADGFLIAYSRTALLDGMLVAFSLATLLAATLARRGRHLVFVGMLLGCAASIKLSGLALALPVAVTIYLRRLPLRSVLLLAVAAPVFYGLYALGLAIAARPYGVLAVYADVARIVRSQAAATAWKHPLLSHWYEWFVPTRLITLRYDWVRDERLRVMTCLGNLASWWASAVAVLVCWVVTVRSAALAVIRKMRGSRAHSHSRYARTPVFILLSFWLSMMLPWMLTKHDSYIYHYLPSYTFGLLLLAGVLSNNYVKRRYFVFGFLLVTALVFAFYAPAWGQLPLTLQGFEQRLPFRQWR